MQFVSSNRIAWNVLRSSLPNSRTFVHWAMKRRFGSVPSVW